MTSPAALAVALASSSPARLTTPPNDQSTVQIPDTPHPAYERMKPRWELCRVLMAGTEAVRAGGDTYLPRMEDESDEAYEFRSTLVALFPGFARTVKASVGLINQTPPVLGDDMPTSLSDLAENIDRAGTHLNVFTRTLTKEGLVDGYGGILVDYPRNDTGRQLSVDEEKRAALRPYWVLVRADDVIKSIYTTVNGVKTLVLLVIREVSEELVGDFSLTTITRYRVYRLVGDTVTYEMWEKAYGQSISTQKEAPTTMNNMTGIPWAPFIAGEKLSNNEIRPPLLDLAYLNLEHHNVKTNIRNLETLALVPTQVRIGAPRDENGQYPPITLGPRSTIEAPYQQGVNNPVYWHSPDVTVLDPSNKSLADIKADMGSAGLAFLAPDTRVAETAAAKRIDSTAQNATITTVAGALQDCLELAFQFTGQYLKEKSGSVTVNTDFENSVMDAQMVSALGALAANGKLDIETLLDLLEDGHILPDGIDKPAILKRILTENAALDTPPADSSGTPGVGDNAPPGGTIDPATGDPTTP